MATKKTKAQVEFKANTSGFNKGIKEMDQSLNTLRKELKLNGTELKGNADDVDLLKERQNILQKESDESAKKVQALTKRLDEARDLFGDNSNEVRSLNNQLLDAKNVYQGIQNEINDTNNKLSKFGAEASDTISSLDRLTNEINQQEKELTDLRNEYTSVVLAQGKSSSEAKELEAKMSSLNSELQENQTKLSKAENASDKFTSSLKKTKSASDGADDGFTVLKGTLADLGANVISSVVSSISGLVQSLLDLGEATEEYRSMQAKLSGASETFGYSIDFANEKYEEFYRYLGDDQMSTNAITNLMGLGTSTESISDIANGAIGVWASYGDSIPIESLTEAVNETIQVGKVTGTFADTINWAKISNEDMSASLGKGSKAQKAFNKAIKDGETQEDAFSMALSATSSQQERAEIVARFLNNTYGESKKTYDEMTGSIQDANTAELDLKETQAQLAEAVAPVNGALAELKNESLQKMLPIVESLSEAFMEFKGWLEEHPVVADILKVALVTLTSVIVTLTAVVVAWTIAQWALNSAILANPITWIIVGIVAAITAVIAIIVVVIKYWDEIVEAVKKCVDFIVQKWNEFVGWINTNVVQPVKKFFSDLWSGIKETASSLWEGIKNAWSSFTNWIDTNIIQPIISFFQGLWDGLVAIWDGIVLAVKIAIGLIASVIDAALQIILLPFTFIWENCKEYVFMAWEWIKEKISTAINYISGIITTIFTAIGTFFTTIWDGIKNIFINAWNAIVNFITPIINNIKNFITTTFNNIKTTCTTIWNNVKNTITTIWNNIKTAISNALNAIKTTATTIWNNIKETISNVVNKIKEVVSNVFNAIKTFASNVWNGIKNVIINPIKNAWTNVKSTVNNIKNGVVNTFESLKSKVTSVFNKIKDGITKPVEKARDAVKKVVDKIKGFFDFEFKLPKIKTPKFGITPKGWKVGDLLEGSIPKLSITWNKEGAIFRKPTLFDTRSGYQGVGEAGAEAVLPIEKLENWMNNGFNHIASSNSYANDRIERLIEVAEDILAKDTNIYMDKEKVGQSMASTNDNISGQRYNFKNRGVLI